MNKYKLILLSLCAVFILTAAVPDKTTTIFVIGDSTAAKKDLSKGKLERGWGMALQCYFDDNIVVDNHAVNGRSSLSFINEGRWDKVMERIKPGDFVIIQFGHNDEKPGAARHSDPGSTFDYNLAKYVRETREKGGTPVLMNCVVRRNFVVKPAKNDDDEKLRNTTFADGGKPVEGDSLIDTHGLYRVAPRDVAQRMNCHFVDANQITHDLEQGLGREGSKKLHMWYLPDTEPTEPKGKQDNTHYNIYGAHVVAKLLADALCEEIPLLKAYRCEADFTVDKEGRGEFFSLEEAVAAAQELEASKAKAAKAAGKAAKAAGKDGKSAGKDGKSAAGKGAQSAVQGDEVTIQILGGEWEKPQLPKKSKIRFVLRQGASWK